MKAIFNGALVSRLGLPTAPLPQHNTVYLDLSQVKTDRFNEVKSHLLAELGGPLAGRLWRIDWGVPVTGEFMDWLYGADGTGGSNALPDATALVGSDSHQTPAPKPDILQMAGSQGNGSSNPISEILNNVAEIIDRNKDIPSELHFLVDNNWHARSRILAEVLDIRFSDPTLSEEALANIDWFLTVMDNGILCRNLDAEAAFDHLMGLLELTELETLPVDYIRIGLDGVDPRTFATYAAEYHHAPMQKIARYFAAALPWETQFWNDYLICSDPAAYLQEMATKAEPWRRGQAFDTHNLEHLRWAYAGLEYPSDLCFEQFRGMMRDAPQVSPPFISEGFKTTVQPGDGAEATEIEFVPSQSPSDMAVGHVSNYSPLTYFGFFDGPGLFLSDWLQDRNIQFFRILADGHLAGMAVMEPMQLYDIEADDFSDQNTLGLRIMPRRSWKCDPEAVLRSVATQLIPIAESHGYAGIHLFSAPGEEDGMVERDERFEEAARNLYPAAQAAMPIGSEVTLLSMEDTFVAMWAKKVS